MKKILKSITSFFNPKNVGIYLLASATVFGLFYYNRSYGSKETVEVNGVAYKDVEANWATWEITVKHESEERLQSLEELKVKETRVIEYLKEQDISDDEIVKGTYDTWRIYEKTEDGTLTDEIKAYASDISYVIETDDVYKIEDLGNKMNEFVVKNDIYLSTNNREYTYIGLEDLKVELLKDAISNARTRADSMGEITGNKVKELEDASQGVFQINPRNDYSVSYGGNFDTANIEKTVRATVTVEFSVK